MKILKRISLAAALLMLVLFLGACASVYQASTHPAKGPKTTAVDPKDYDGSTATGIPGCKCHSSYRGMRRMHRTFTVTDCSRCHSSGAPTGDKSKEVDIAKARKRMKSDKNCFECHGTIAVSDKDTTKKASQDSKDMYCIKCKNRFSTEYKFCPNDGSRLISVSKITEASKKKPGNGICLVCHPQEKEFLARHPKNIKPGNKLDCLKCHKNHWDCESCHHH